MTPEKLKALLEARNLSRLSDRLVALARPVIKLVPAPRPEPLPPGASKLGGLPDLPEGTPWPD